MTTERFPLFDQAIRDMKKTFRILESSVPPPKKVPYKNSFIFRYSEKNVEQALVQKLVRVISGLHAIQLLLKHGLVQEQGVIQRVLDELDEDINFLVLGKNDKHPPPFYNEYLETFWAEIFDGFEGREPPKKKKYMAFRQKIRKYLNQKSEEVPNPAVNEKMGDVMETLGNVYSGFVHSASPQIMDVYGGNPPRFHIDGMLGTPRVDEHKQDACNYFYRALMSFAMVAKLFEKEFLVESLYSCLGKFEEESRHF